MNHLDENDYCPAKNHYFSFQGKRIQTITRAALSSIFLFISFLSFSQDSPPAMATPTPENARLIDTLIQVTRFEDYFRAYCKMRISERAKQQKWSAATIKKFTDDIDLKYFFTIHNALSHYNTTQLEGLISKYRVDPQSARLKNVIIDNHIVRANLKYFGDNLLNGVYSASETRAQSRPITTNYSDTKSLMEVPPEYPGGIDEFLKFIEDEFHRPDTFASSEAEDKLLASFVIEKDGSLVDIVILKDLGYGTGEELKRVLSLSKKWKPAMQEGKPVRVSFTLPVRLPLPGIKIDGPPPITEFTLRESAATSKTLNLVPLILTKKRYLFGEKFSPCMREDYHFESGKQAFSDRFSMISQISEGIAADTLKKLTGRICFEVLIDSLGQSCVLSLQNDLNIPGLASQFKEAIETKTKWKIAPVDGRRNEPVSAILVFSFTNARMYYRHMGFTATSPNIVELEASERGKFTAY